MLSNSRAARVGRDSGGPSRQSPLRLYMGVLAEKRTYLALLYLAIAFPLGLGGFVALVTLVATGGGTAITIVGIPILIATMYGWCLLASLHAVFANSLLGTRIPPLFRPLPGKPWQYTAMKARIKEPMTWRAFAYTLYKFVHGTVALVVLSLVASHIVLITLAPLFAEIPSPTVFWGQDGLIAEPNPNLADGLYAFGFHFTTWYEALPLTALGLLMLPLAGHIIRLAGYISGRIDSLFLSTGATFTPDQASQRHVETAIAWEGVLSTAALEKGSARTIGIHTAALGIHLLSSVAILAVLVAINAFASPDNWWVLFVAWAASMPLFAHAGFYARGHVGAHVGLFISINIGLFVIDAVYSENTWFFYPLVIWAGILAVHIVAWNIYQRSQTGDGLPSSNWRHALANVLAEEPKVATTANIVPAPTGATDSAPTTESTASATVTASSDAAATVAEPAPGVDIDGEMRRVTVDGEEVELTPKEFELLSMLTANPGKPFSREHLLDRIWTNDYEVTDRTIDTHVLRLRKKLGSHGSSIQTVWGIGYKWTPESAPAKSAEPEPKLKSSGW